MSGATIFVLAAMDPSLAVLRPYTRPLRRERTKWER
jgi:hypothetical protein